MGKKKKNDLKKKQTIKKSDFKNYWNEELKKFVKDKKEKEKKRKEFMEMFRILKNAEKNKNYGGISSPNFTYKK